MRIAKKPRWRCLYNLCLVACPPTGVPCVVEYGHKNPQLVGRYTMMQTKKLGRTNLSIPALGLGCVTFGREIDKASSFAVMDHAMALGVTLFDSAEGYGGGNARQYRRKNLNVDDEREVTGEMHSSELIVGRWLRERKCRGRVFLCTKMLPPNQPDNIERAVGASLERLSIDCIDLFMLHTWDDDAPIGETLDALTQQVRNGRVRCVGASNITAEQLTESLACSEAHGYARFDAVENNYNLSCREPEQDVLPVCGLKNVSFIAYSPLGGGFLTGKYTPDRGALPAGTRFDVLPGHCDAYFSDRNFRVVQRLRKLSESIGQSMAHLAAAWAVTNDLVACTLFGARKLEHLDNAVAALNTGLDPALRTEMAEWE